ncbi:PilZ domain-containing protein [Stappia taiwanensis]|uniref:PilZ domain-containing protein n=1 Tax=Stappia taiwanensis TaxID=992267 RepID=A0A838XNV2_9HYPH|nr:PilZ domain-containing protein [Stappia taiwanensis]MBA4610286.1 PilZ domain-containing protein [Stappia taiwanensis]GGE78396.1 hypothetical protein GCM10007285_02740 [Stappia taiwanensis]
MAADKPTVRGEIRSVPRADCSLPAVLHDKGMEIACVIENLSISGCRVRLPRRALLSENFILEFSGRGIRVAAELVWLNGEEAGLRFHHERPADVPSETATVQVDVP